MKDIAMWACAAVGSGALALLAMWLWLQAVETFVCVCRIKKCILSYYWHRRAFHKWLDERHPHEAKSLSVK